MHPGWKQTLFKSSLFILTQSLHFWGSRIKKIILKGPRYEFEQSVKQSQNFGLSLQFMEMLISFFMQLEWDMAKHRNTLSVLCVEAKGSPSAGNCRAEGIISLCSIYDWKFILSNIATVFSKQDHLGLPSQRLLRNIGWTLLGSRACFLLSFSSLLTKGHWKPFCEIAITTDLGEK